jgi:hypothetical protein
MLNNYIQNKLSEAEIEQVELWLADNPDVMKDLEMGVMFKQADFAPIEKSNESKSFNLFDFFSSRKLIPVNILVYGLVGVLAFNLFSTSNQNSHGEGNFQIVSLSPLRGSSNDEFIPISTIKINNRNNQLILVVQLNFPDKSNYSIELENHISHKIIFKLNGLKAIGVGDLNISIPTEILEKGDYWINIESSEGQVEKLPISFE